MRARYFTGLVALATSLGCGANEQRTDSTGPPDLVAPADAARPVDAARPLDAGLPHDAQTESSKMDVAPDVPEYPPCPVGLPPNSTVQGTTPRGGFNGRYAWFGKAEGECRTSIFVVFAEVPDMMPRNGFARPAPPILWFSRAVSSGDTIGLGPAEAEIEFTPIDRISIPTAGNVDLTRAEYPRRFPDARVEGTIALSADGFEISGSFSAPYCPWMDIYCP